jgi:hypothetical protein
MGLAKQTLDRWAKDPVALVREEFHAEPDAWQHEAMMAIASPDVDRLAMKACKGPGKTTVLAWIILWFLATRRYARIGATSITEANIDANLWPEINKWMMLSAFYRRAFVWTKTAIVNRDEPGNWFCQKRSWPKSANAEAQANALAGLHADHVMFVLDESGGIPQAVMVTAEAVLATEGSEGKLVQAGNPTHTTGPLYRACTIDRHLWRIIRITGDPDDPKRSPRISVKWAREQIASYGRSNPWVMVNVLGEFPPASINALLGVEDVEAAMARHLREDVYTWAQKRLGVDVARFGDDRTVIFPRQGMASFRPVTMRAAKTTEIAARVMLASVKWGAELILVDDTGHWGHGVIDNLTTAGLPAIGINYAGKALDPRFKNRRAEFYIKGSEAIKNGAALPPIPELVPELTEQTYTFLNGVFQLEEKDQIKARLGFSPDLADAYMQTYALEDLPSSLLTQVRGRQTVRHDGDPYPREERPHDDGVGQVAHDFDPLR